MKMLKPFNKKIISVFAGAMLLLIPTGVLLAAEAAPKSFELNKPIKIAIVNFKTCVEKSKLGKQEQANFDAMKKQMETILEDKEKTLNEMAAKFNDIDYLDSLSPEAETELKRKFRALSQEASQQQNQYYQALSQANVKIIEKITGYITKASEEVAKKHKIDLMLNEDSSFFNSPELDISTFVVAVMDEKFDIEAKESKEAQPGAPIP